MPLFLSDDEFRRWSGDAATVAEKADAFIRELYSQIDTVKAEADAASITLEQTSSLIEQKYVSLSGEYSSLQSQLEELKLSLEKRDSELGRVQSEKQQILLQSIEKDGEIERLTKETSELHKSKRQLMELLEQKDLEVSEKNATMKSYLDKIVNLSENVASKEARVGELESEVGRLQATAAGVLQEKELLERHNKWLNEELTAKVDSLIQLRKTKGELEADLSSKLTDAERKFQESSSSLQLHKDRARNLEEKLAAVEKDLLATKDSAAAAEERSYAEIATVKKLVDLYKEGSEEWSKKAGELEGVIKALEKHLNQVENEYKDRLEKEASSRMDVDKENADLKEKLQTNQTELEKLRKENELTHLPLSSFTLDSSFIPAPGNETSEDDRAIVPSIPSGISGTALAASLLRDGWTLAKIYAKYQEAVDALRHEQLGRKQTQAILERVLYEIEEKTGVIMDEREEHDRLVESYSALDQKLQHSLSQHSILETTIHDLKANLKRQEREYSFAQKEIADLEKQVTILLKECRDVQIRCGSTGHHDYDGLNADSVIPLNIESNPGDVISEKLLTFKDINGLVEQNVQLRTLVRKLSDQIANKEAELKEKYEDMLRKHNEETASKVTAILKRAEEQAQMVESLHASVAMYKKLYEDEHKLRGHPSNPEDVVPEQGSKKHMLLLENNDDTTRKVHERAFERLKSLEEDMTKSRGEINSLRAERDKFSLEAQFAQEKLDRFMKEFEHQRAEQNGVIARNVEFSQLIVDYQRRLRESTEALDASNELSRKLKIEVSYLKNEKEVLQNSEKRASDEVRSLSERLYRLQASLDTIQSTEEVREEARGIEKRKQEEYVRKIEREWADAKRELQEERDAVRSLTHDRETTLKNALEQVEELSKDLANAMQSVAAAEARAAIAEARCSDLEKIMESTRTKNSDGTEGAPSSASSDKVLASYREEIERLKTEAESSNDHMLQYKRIAQVNEEALKQIELAYRNYKNETEEVKKMLEAELHSLKDRIDELENECKRKAEEAVSANAGKEEALMGVLSEISSLKNDCSVKESQIVVMESQISALKEDLEREHQRWRTAQDNYERQVILQSETIQELTKTSQTLASVQEEAFELRKAVDTLTSENSELKTKWETEKLAIEVYRNDADKKYNEVNELNKMLHSRLEALHIKMADKEKGTTPSSQNSTDDDGLHNIVNYLRRSKEIAETEISLLKQEKIRLQSQVEIALKSAEEAQATLHTEREKSRSSLCSEDEFKSLQLKVRELTLLRESNLQLREESRRNFEECQKLREALRNAKIETKSREKLLRDRDVELEALRKEIEMLKMEKGQLEKKIDELGEKCKNVNIDEYNRLKESSPQMEASLKEKDAQLDDIKKQLSDRQDTISILERDLGKIKSDLSDKEARINEIVQAEASMKSETEKIKRANGLLKRRYDNTMKEKEELSKEVQALSKQLEETKQAKRNTPDSAAEEALREKEKEKDTRIQILERTLERHRDDLKKEKEDLHKEKERNQKMRKTVIDSREIVMQQRTKLSDELTKHKQALRVLQDEVEKLKNSGGSGAEGASVVQHVSFTVLDDFASAYYQAVENFKQVVQPASVELDSSTPDAPPDNAQSTVQAVSSSTPTPAIPAANVPSTRTNEEKERRLAITKVNVKTGRKLVRPSITRPKEPQGEVEMTEADEAHTGLSSQNVENQGNVTVPAVSSARKRPSTSLSSDIQEDVPPQEETSPDIPAHLSKKPKGLETVQAVGEELSKLSEPAVAGAEEMPEDVGNLQQGTNKDETIDAEKDEFETAVDQAEETVADEQMQVELANETVEAAAEEKLDKSSETLVSDDQLRYQTEQDIQRIVTESGGDKDSELVGDFADNDGDSSEMTGTGTEEFQTEQSGDPENSPGAEPSSQAGLEAGEIEEDKNVDATENIAESSKLNEAAGTDPVTEAVPDPVTEAVQTPVTGTINTATTEEASTSTSVDVGSTEQGGSTPPPPVSPVSSSSTTINLQERARQRAHLRQQGAMTASAPSRGRGRTIRGRGTRGGGRPGRGQSSG